MSTAMRVRELVEQQARAAIRNDGLDPLSQPEKFRALVEQCAMDTWIAQGARSVDGDPAVVAKEVLRVISGFGELQQFFDDPTIEEIWLNEPGRVFIARHGTPELTSVVLGVREVRDLVWTPQAHLLMRCFLMEVVCMSLFLISLATIGLSMFDVLSCDPNQSRHLCRLGR